MVKIRTFKKCGDIIILYAQNAINKIASKNRINYFYDKLDPWVNLFYELLI